MAGFTPLGLGWRRDAPDFRDWTVGSPQAKELLKSIKQKRGTRSKKQQKQDLREYFPPVQDQQCLEASPAHACIGLVEYFTRRALGKTMPFARLFLHQCAQKLLLTERGAGADLRTTLKAMVRFGLPPERFWPYDVKNFDRDPDPYLYAFSDSFHAVRYIRLDGRNATGSETLSIVKAFLAAGFPSVFGFPVPASISEEADIPYRPTFDATTGGQAVVAVGYDDRRPGPTRGALLIRNSWGSQWGESGYGWLPYVYVREQIAVDFWTLFKSDWIKSGEFQRPDIP